MAKFADVYSAVFDAVKAALVYVAAVTPSDEVPEGVPAKGVASIKTVVLEDEPSYGVLPKAVICPDVAPIEPLSMGDMVKVHVGFSVTVLYQEYAPKNWFDHIIPVMGDVVDAVLADVTLGGAAKNCWPVMFAPGEIKFKKDSKAPVDKTLFGGEIVFVAEVWFSP
jgi:hypothetical protein